MPRRFFFNRRITYTSRLDTTNPIDNWCEIQLVSQDAAKNTVTATIREMGFDGGGLIEVKDSDTIVGRFREKTKQHVNFRFRDELLGVVQLRLKLFVHPTNPDKDLFSLIMRGGLTEVLKKLFKPDGNEGGGMDDPDVEGFNRHGQPVNGGAGTAMVASGGNKVATRPAGADMLVPGSVIVKTAAGVLVGYDQNSRLISAADGTTDLGPVVYGSAATAWSVTSSDMTADKVFVDTVPGF